MNRRNLCLGGMAIAVGMPRFAAGMTARNHRSVGKVVTVRGDVDPVELGGVLIHEHLLIAHTPPQYVLASPQAAIEEVKRYTSRDLKLGKSKGHTVVDVTTTGIRFPSHAQNLFDISIESGAHVVMGTGYYLAANNPMFANATVSELLAGMQLELLNGVKVASGPNHTVLVPEPVRAGIIGELGVSTLSPGFERNVLVAAARAHRISRVPISLHFNVAPWDVAAGEGAWNFRMTVLKFLVDNGVAPNRIVLGHCSPVGPDSVGDPNGAANLTGMFKALDAGCYLGIDGWGSLKNRKDFDSHKLDENYRNYAATIKRLVVAKGAKRIMLSQDVCGPEYLNSQGGLGYAHIVDDVVPFLLRADVSESDIALMTAFAAQQFLTVN